MDLHTRASAVDELEAMRVYDRADLEQHLAALAAEAEELRSAIAAAEAHRDALAAAVLPCSETEQLGAIMVEAQEELTVEWDACRRFDAALEAGTELLAERILAEGRALADALHTIVAEMGARRSGEAPDAGDRWWNHVIDLTQEDQPERAPIS